MTYAELQVTSNYGFLRGASHPEELAETAAALGHAAVAITDSNTLSGVVRAHTAAKKAGIRAVVGCRLDLDDGLSVLVYPTGRAAYGRLARLLTLGKRRAPKGECHLTRGDLFLHGAGQIVIALPPVDIDTALSALDADAPFARDLGVLAERFAPACYLAGQVLYRGDDRQRLARLAALARAHHTPMVATNDVHYHVPARRPLQDVLSCIREHTTIEEAGYRLHINAERHLKSPEEMARLFRDYPDAIARTLEIAEACAFSLDELRYEYPAEVNPGGGVSAQEELARLTWRGARERYPDGVAQRVEAVLNHELGLIAELGYAPYFLTVYDVVRFARSRAILCQGRGSAANSAVCYCLGITAVDPGRVDLLFERFISAERNEPPDIDVDFEHERREEVIQYIYEKYGRHRAGMTATVITYRWRSAIREVVKALGLSEDVGGALAGNVWGSPNSGIDDDKVREVGLDPTDRRLATALTLAHELIGFPRHLSQHPGGFVITRGPLSEVVPIANAAMEDRTMIEWDKDDIDALGILKIDVLGLGILTCIRKGFDLLARHYGRSVTLATLPPEDPAVYDMLCRGDSLGVFQVESRAQMTMLPRLKPRSFYDLVIEVAIVRPGPIQGDMVHPYLRRRRGEEAVAYPSEELREVLGKTLGVPLFQEQAMKIAIVAAGFEPAEADGLRRAMATFRHSGTIHNYRDRFIGGMVARGYDEDFATRCFQQIEGFGEYGFPESHAASFALLVYVSAWLKRHYPAVFACALLNSQPMGFYAPAQIVRDARDHGAVVRAVDVNHSGWDCTLEPLVADHPLPTSRTHASRRAQKGAPQHEVYEAPISPYPEEGRSPVSKEEGGSEEEAPKIAMRLGLRQIKGFKEDDADRLVAERGSGYRDVYDLWRRAGLGAGALEKLAEADAFASMGLKRRAALWAVRGLKDAPLSLFAAAEARAATHPAKSPSPSFEGEGRGGGVFASKMKGPATNPLPGPPPDPGGGNNSGMPLDTTPIEILHEPTVTLPDMAIGEEVIGDYTALRLSLKHHPMELLRPMFTNARAVQSHRLAQLKTGARVEVAGLVICRQRPGTASGVIFMTLEDETGVANVVVWPKMFETFRKPVLRARLIAVKGKVERDGLVIHVIADHIADRTERLLALADGHAMPPVHKVSAGRWGTGNFDSVGAGRLFAPGAHSRPPSGKATWPETGRADEAARGGTGDGRGSAARIRPKRPRSLDRDFPSHDFH